MVGRGKRRQTLHLKNVPCLTMATQHTHTHTTPPPPLQNKITHACSIARTEEEESNEEPGRQASACGPRPAVNKCLPAAPPWPAFILSPHLAMPCRCLVHAFQLGWSTCRGMRIRMRCVLETLSLPTSPQFRLITTGWTRGEAKERWEAMMKGRRPSLSCLGSHASLAG